MAKEIKFKVVTPSYEEIKETEEYKSFVEKVKSMVKIKIE